MGNRLATRAGAVDVRALVRTQNSKMRIGESLRRDVDMSPVSSCRAGEEDGLTLSPFGEVGGQGRVKLHDDEREGYRPG